MRPPRVRDKTEFRTERWLRTTGALAADVAGVLRSVVFSSEGYRKGGSRRSSGGSVRVASRSLRMKGPAVSRVFLFLHPRRGRKMRKMQKFCRSEPFTGEYSAKSTFWSQVVVIPEDFGTVMACHRNRNE